MLCTAAAAPSRSCGAAALSRTLAAQPHPCTPAAQPPACVSGAAALLSCTSARVSRPLLRSGVAT
eukprot:4127229-Prymnesium_polylepis.1